MALEPLVQLTYLPGQWPMAPRAGQTSRRQGRRSPGAWGRRGPPRARRRRWPAHLGVEGLGPLGSSSSQHRRTPEIELLYIELLYRALSRFTKLTHAGGKLAWGRGQGSGCRVQGAGFRAQGTGLSLSLTAGGSWREGERGREGEREGEIRPSTNTGLCWGG